MGNGQFQPGQVPWNKKTPIKKTCPKCGKTFSVRPSWDRVKCCSRRCAGLGRPSGMKGRTPSDEVRQKLRESQLGRRGPDHWNWRGGSGTERHQAMARDEYIQWRKAVFERDNYTCRHCGVRGATLHAHHVYPWAKYPEKRFDVSNGCTLCAPCHYSTPNYPNKLIPKGN